MPDQSKESFADIAVALTLLASKVDLDLAKTRMIAERIGLSKMGLSTIVDSLETDAKRVQSAIALFKEMAEVEDQVRAVLARRKTRRWSPRLVGAVS